MYANGASNTACMFTQQGRKGTNQDAMLVWEVRDRPELLPSLEAKLLLSAFVLM
jgi:hypothetical protein